MNEGWIDAAVAAELPDLRLHWTDIELPAGIGRSGPEVKERLRKMSDGFRGGQAIAMRTQPIHHAQRVFFRHIGLDPDRDRPPAEALAVERLRAGAFTASNELDDAIVIAVLETGVPVWALDREPLSGELGIRGAREGEPVGEIPQPVGRLVVADAERAVAVLYGDVGLPPGKRARAVRLFSVQVAGVPSIHVEEALWTVCDTLGVAD